MSFSLPVPLLYKKVIYQTKFSFANKILSVLFFLFIYLFIYLIKFFGLNCRIPLHLLFAGINYLSIELSPSDYIFWLFSLTAIRADSTQLATRRRGYVVAISICTSQRRSRYISNEAHNSVSVERRQVVSVVYLYDVLLNCPDNVSPW